MRRRLAGQSVWMEHAGSEGAARRKRMDLLELRIWTLGWGLLFAVAIALLSTEGPHLAYSKVPAGPAVSDAAVRAVK